MSADAECSQVADAQLDALEGGPDADLYNAILDTIDLIFRLPGQAQALDGDHHRRRDSDAAPVIGHPPYKVFWSMDVPESKRSSRIP